MTRTLAAVARETRGRLVGADGAFGRVTTDSRALTAGALFVAIAGDQFDGNDFVADAHKKGAAGRARVARSRIRRCRRCTWATRAARSASWRAPGARASTMPGRRGHGQQRQDHGQGADRARSWA